MGPLGWAATGYIVGKLLGNGEDKEAKRKEIEKNKEDYAKEIEKIHKDAEEKRKKK